LDYSKEYILEACEKSLRRLKRDCIDYYQLHSARVQHFEKEQCIEAMEELEKAGKIRHWGLSLNTFLPAAEAELLIEKNAGAGFQLVFNLINQKALPVMQEAAKQGYGIIARMPLQFGLLSGNIKPDTTFSTDDHRSYRLVPAIIEQVLQVLKQEVWPLLQKYQTTEAGLALSYILSYDEVSVVIPGIRTPEHVALNTNHLVQLETADKIHLRNIFETHWQPVMDMMEKQG